MRALERGVHVRWSQTTCLIDHLSHWMWVSEVARRRRRHWLSVFLPVEVVDVPHCEVMGTDDFGCAAQVSVVVRQIADRYADGDLDARSAPGLAGLMRALGTERTGRDLRGRNRRVRELVPVCGRRAVDGNCGVRRPRALRPGIFRWLTEAVTSAF